MAYKRAVWSVDVVAVWRVSVWAVAHRRDDVWSVEADIPGQDDVLSEVGDTRWWDVVAGVVSSACTQAVWYARQAQWDWWAGGRSSRAD